MPWIRQPRFFPGVRAALVTATLVTLLAAPSAFAASQTWDGGGGNGSWQTVTNWIGDVGFPGTASAVYTSTDDATFGGLGSGTVSLGGSLNVRSIIFGTAGADASAFTIGGAGDTLYLTTGGSLTINSGVTTNQTIGIAGTTLNLSNAASATAVFTNNGSGTLTIASNIAANVASGNGLLTVAGTGNTTITGTITKPGAGSYALMKTGSGTLTLAKDSSWTGTGAASGGFSGPLIAQAGTLLFAGGTHTITGEAVIGGVITNGGAGNNAKIQVDAGRVDISGYLSVGRGNGVGGVSSDLVLNNAAVMSAANMSAGYNGASAANLPKGTITLNGSSSLTITGNGVFNLAESAGSDMSMTLNGSSQAIANGTGIKYIGNAGRGSLTINNTANVSFGNAITYLGHNTGTGFLTINGGTFTAGGEVRVGGSDLNGTGINAVGTLVMTGGTATVSALTLARGNNNQNTVAGTGTISGGVFTSTNDVILGYAGSGNLGKLVIAGGTFNVATSAAKWLYVGVYDTSRGQLDISSGALNLMTNSSIKMNGNTTTGANVVNQTGGSVTFYGDNGSTIGGTGVLDLQTSGSAASSNTYNLDGGTLTVPQVLATTTSGTRTFNFNGGTLRAAISTGTFFSLGSGGTAVANVRNGGAIIDTNGKAVTIPQVLAHSTIGGDAATDGGLTKLGSGTLTLTGANTYTGTTTLNAGVVNLGVAEISGTSGPLGASAAANPGNIVLAGGTLQYSAANQFDYSGRFSTAANQKYNIDTNSTTGTWASGLASSGGTLTKSGAGTLALTGSSTYSGGTRISAGTLGMAGASGTNSNLGSGTVTIPGGGILRAGYAVTSNTNISTTTNAISLAGGAIWADDGNQRLAGALDVTSSGTLGSTYNAGTNTAAERDKGLAIQGVVTGSGPLTIQHSRISTGNNYNTSFVSFSNNANTYSGTITINENTTTSEGGVYLGVNGSTALRYATIVTSTIPGTFQRFGSSPIVFNTGLGSATLGAISGSGGLVLTGYNQSTHVYGTDAIALTVGGNGASTTYAGAISGSGSLTKAGAGTLTLSAASTYVGATTISSGTLALSGTGSVNSSSGIAINGSGAGLLQVGTVASTPAITLTLGTLAGSGTVGAVTVNGTGGVVVNGNADTSTLRLASLTYSATGAMTLNMASDLVTPAVAVTGALTTMQGIPVNIATSPGWVSGNTYNLISYGSLNGSGTNFVAGTIVGLGARQAPAFGDTGAGSGYVTLTIQGDTPYWTGAGSNAWTTGTGTLDWNLLIGGSSTYFITNDQVLFDDNASGSTTVDISTGNVGVASVVFNNTSKDYVITSSGGYGIADGSASPAQVTKNGSGRATLTTANTYTGATTINAGVLQLGDGITDGTLASPTVANAAALQFQVVGSTTYAGVISGTGTLTKSGAGTLTLSGTSTATGSVTISAGVLNVTGGLANTAPVTVNGGVYTVGASDTVGAVTLSSGTINGSGVLTASSYALQNGTIVASLAGAGAITKTTSGTVTLTGSNAPTTNVTLSAGRLNINHASALGATTTGTLVINGGTIDTTSGSALTTAAAKAQTWAGDFSTGSGTLSFNNGVATVTGAGTRTLTLGGGLLTVGSISSTSNALTIAGSGTLALSANTATDQNSNTKIGGLLTVSSGATLQINTGSTVGTTGDVLVSMLGGSGTISTSNIARWVFLNGAGVTGTFAGTLAGPLGLCADSGSGTVTLSGNNTLTDRITSGTNWTVILTGNNVGRPAGTNSLTYVANGGTLQLQANSGNTVSGTSFALSSERTANSPLTLNGGGTLQLRGDSDVTFAGGNSMGGLGSATVTIDVNAISGGTIGKTLTIAPSGFDTNTTTLNVTGGNDYALGLGRITDINASTGTTTINANTGRVTLAAFASTATANTHVLALGGAMAGNTITGSISNGTGSAVTAVEKNGGGTWTLTGTSGYTGATTINSGTLALGGAGLFGNGSYAGAITNNGALVVATSANQTLSGTVSGVGSLAKSGAGTLTLSAANTYTGATTIASGTLVTGIANAISGSSAITIGSAGSRGALQISHPLTISSLTFTGQGGDVINPSTGTATFSSTTGTATIAVLAGTNAFHANAVFASPTLVDVSSEAYFTFHSNLSGSASLTKAGVGTMELTGDSDPFSGNLFVTAGRVNVGVGMNQLGTGTTTLSGGSIIDLNGQALTDRIVVLDGAILNAGGTATTTTIAGPSTFSGTTALLGTYNITSTGSARFESAVGNGSSIVTVNVSGTGGQAVFAGVVSGSANVTVYSGGMATFGDTVAGRVTSHGASTFNGTLLSGAETQVQDGGSAVFTASTAAGSTVAVASGGTAEFRGTMAGIATVSGSALFTSASGLTGSLTVNPGVAVTFDNVAATITGDVDNDGTLTINRTSGSQAIAGAIHGTGSLVKQGAGTLTFTSAQAYTGSTIISGGTLALASGASLASTYVKAGAAAGDGGVLDVTSLGSGLNVASGQKLGGYGTVLGDVMIAGGAIVAPGGSIGTLTNAGTETWGAAGHYLFEITNAGGTTPGTSWDLLTVSALAITATSGIGNQFVIDLQSLTSGTDQSAGAMTGGNWDPTANYEWKFLVADTTTFSAANFDTSWFTVTTSTSTFPNTINGSFYVARGGNNGGLGGSTNSNELYIVYAAVPEPGTLVLAATGAVLSVFVLRRRRLHRERWARRS